MYGRKSEACASLFPYVWGESDLAEAKKAAHRSVTEIAEELARPLIDEMGLSLWDVTWQKEGVDWCLTFFIDKEGGADLNDCEAFSRAVDPLLDETDPVQEGYYLQVFTPGLERKLTKPAHFEAYLGEKIFLLSIRPVEGQREFHGILKGFDGQNLLLESEGNEYSFPIKSLSFVKADDFDPNVFANEI